MTEKERPPESSPQDIPSGQRWFDNIWLWFVLSFLISGLIYNIWGILELYR